MNSSLTHKNSVELLANGADFINKNIQEIQKAHKYIFFQTYIFIEDEVTTPLLEALIQKAKEGIHVFILLDSFGSPQLSLKMINKFNSAGIRFKYFTPLFQFSHIGRRLHQKVLIIDNEMAIIGGINYGKIFQNPINAKPWLDYACIVAGEAVNDLYNKLFPIFLKSFPTQRIELEAIKDDRFLSENNCTVKVNVNDWMRYKQDIYKSYINGIKKAEKEVILLATYFIPNKKLLKTLNKAAKNGVQIHLIFSSESDHPIIDLLCDYFYEWYLNCGIHIYEWDKSVIHGKVAVIDDHWSTVGSYNHNYISQYGNIEANLEIFNDKFAKSTKKELLSILHESRKITHSHLQRGFINKIKIYSVYLLANIIILFSIAFVYKRKE